MELTEVNALNMTLRGSRVCEEKGRRGRGERRRRSLIDFKGQIRSPRIIGIQCDNLSRLPDQFRILLEARVGGIGRVPLQRQTWEMSLGTSFIAWCSFKSALCGRSGFMSGSIHSTQHGTLPKSAPYSPAPAPFRCLIRLSIVRAPTTTR